MAGHLPRDRVIPGLSAAVLAGGQSRRMGQDKLALRFGRGTVLDAVLETLGSLSDDVFVVGREVTGTRSVSDRLPERCAMSGLHAALCEARHPRVLVVAGDMPLLEPSMLRVLAGFESAVPQVEGRLQPLCAVYPVACLQQLVQGWAEGERSVTRFVTR
ncbi:MAG: molybdenum cofactor guanylyltransferase, partial [Candidatus Xenobia bacterium]